MNPAPLLVLGVGNPSRGDDALGPLFVERLSEALAGEVASGKLELLTDFQLQIEHALDLEGRARVVFVDASVRAAPPFEFGRIRPRRDLACSTHSLSPEAVLDTHRVLAGEPPESWLLAIRGERFELGDPLTPNARAYLEAAVSFFIDEARGARATRAARRLELEGIVQGVGFRPWVYRVATALGLSGQVENTPDGVRIDAFGSGSALDALVHALQSEPPRGARIRALRITELPAEDREGFIIGPSRGLGAAGVGRSPAGLSIPPDLATCDPCRREVNDPHDRHHGYAFTACTACGPRFAIANAAPFDRGATALAPFAPCAACAAEYSDPADRRFHAQTLACPRCGPRVVLLDAHGRERPSTDPIASAAAQLCDGQILAVHGLGAFHLVCDASAARVVSELRRRKRRDSQPFAVMVRDLAEAERVAELDDAARDALSGPARPIVLAPARPSPIAREVMGPSRRAGVMLPYTPLHEHLLAGADRPLVVTSGNPSGGPAVIDAAEAVSRLRGIADGFLVHDRAIARRVEDSVLARAPGGTRVLRRARGFAPLPVRLPAAAPEPVLAVGGHLKNTACVVLGDLAYLTPHLGDLELVESQAAWRREVESFERLLGARAEVIAHDLHPDYASTRYALERPARHRIGVQHHAAHVLSAVAELQLDEPVVGVVFDGSGWGPDGTSWGAEILIVDGARWTRASSFRPLPLAGGERAIREVWRTALAALLEAFGAPEALSLATRLPVFEGFSPSQLAAVSRQLEAGVATVPARGMGRWFDALGALVLGLPRAGFEGHVAIAFEEAAESGAATPYPCTLPSAVALGEASIATHEVDLRPTVRAAVADVIAGITPGCVAARFHATIVEATAAVVAEVLASTGLRRVVLTGGAFQNQRLERGLRERLGADRVAMARELPINDGGLCLGQAWAAVLALRAGGEANRGS
jgi:hydrogenase maturation protein HypF